MTRPAPELPVVVIGAGPVGLAAAAHLRERAIPALVLEAGAASAAGVATWGHVRLFSPWSSLIDPAARRLLERDLAQTDWTPPPAAEHPTGAAWREAYLLPLAAALGPDAVRTGHRVVAVTRLGHDLMLDEGRSEVPYVLTVAGPDGEHRVLARAVVDASGTLGMPSPLGADGTAAAGEPAARAAGAVASAIPDLPGDPAHAGRHTAVVGGGHSAMTALLGLLAVARRDPTTRITWVLRRPLAAARFGGGSADQLAQRGALGQRVAAAVGEGRIDVRAPFRVTEVAPDGDGWQLRTADGDIIGGLDRILALTGFRPDLSLTAEVRLDLDPALQAPRRLAPLIDPNVHSCGTVPPHGIAELRHPDEGYVVVGMKSYGRAPTFLALTGYEQVRSTVAWLAGDLEAAARVELVLPETGVCGGSGITAAQQADVAAAAPLALVGEGSGCC